MSLSTGDRGGVAVTASWMDAMCLWKAFERAGAESLFLSCSDLCRERSGGSPCSSVLDEVEFPTVLLRARNMLDKL